MSRWFFIWCAFGLLTACNSSKVVVDKGPVKERSTTYLVKRMHDQQMSYETMVSDIHFDGTFEGRNMKFKGKLIHINDSLIWMNMTKFGLEVGRVMITRDSFHMMNRLLKEYTAEPLAYLEHAYNVVPDFDVLENALVGVPNFPDNTEIDVMLDGSRHRLRGASGVRNVDLTVWLNGFTHMIEEAHFEDDQGRKITINYVQEGNSNNSEVPNRSFNAENIDTEDYLVNCQFQNPNYNQPQTPRFKVPKRYDRVR